MSLGHRVSPWRTGHTLLNHVHTLRFVKRARNLGFSIEETGMLLALWRDKRRPSAVVKQLATKHVRDLEAKISELRAMVRTLRHLANHCHGDGRPECPILDVLADIAGHGKPARRKNGKATKAPHDNCRCDDERVRSAPKPTARHAH